jgi:hypothetical protein
VVTDLSEDLTGTGFFLKGQCHEIVVEMILSGARTGLFPLTNRPFQSYGAWCMTSIGVKLGSQIRRILLQLGFRFESEAEIAPRTAIALSRIPV